LGMGTELEGLEMIGFLPPMSTPLLGISDMVIMSDAGKIIDVGGKASDAIGKTTEVAGKANESIGKQLSNEKVKTNNKVEQATNQLKGIEKAQDVAKNAVKGSKQNKIQSISKSQQRLTNALKELRGKIDLKDLDFSVIPITPKPSKLEIKKDNTNILKKEKERIFIKK